MELGLSFDRRKGKVGQEHGSNSETISTGINCTQPAGGLEIVSRKGGRVGQMKQGWGLY